METARLSSLLISVVDEGWAAGDGACANTGAVPVTKHSMIAMTRNLGIKVPPVKPVLTSAFKVPVALAVIAAAFFDPNEPAVGVVRLVGHPRDFAPVQAASRSSHAVQQLTLAAS